MENKKAILWKFGYRARKYSYEAVLTVLIENTQVQKLIHTVVRLERFFSGGRGETAMILTTQFLAVIVHLSLPMLTC